MRMALATESLGTARFSILAPTPEHLGVNTEIPGDLRQTDPLLINQPDGFFLELFGVTLSLRYDKPPGALSRFSDVSTISAIDQVVF